MSHILRFFIHHRVAANLLMVLMVLGGIFGLLKLNTQFFPNFELDFAVVRVVWTGASAEDVERAITIPIEQELRNLDYLKEITSTSATGVCNITLAFHAGTDMGQALDDINERMGRIRNLPASAEKAQIRRIARYEKVARVMIAESERMDSDAVRRGHVSGDRLQELATLAYRFRDRLLDMGIAKVDVNGIPKQEIAIEVPMIRQKELGLSVNAIATRIGSQSRDLPAGFIGKGDVSRQLRSLDQRRDVRGFSGLPLLTDENGRLIRVGDIARVERRAKDGQIRLYHNHRPAVELVLRRNENGDSLRAANILHSWLKEVGNKVPAHIHIIPYDESWRMLEERINLLLTNGLGGLLLVIVILFIFLNGHVAFWVTVGIPVSFMATLGVMYLAGGSLNMISLFGMIMALGIIVDDAIVVAERAQHHFEEGHDAKEAAEQGARSMWAPVTSSSLTTVAAFLPLMLVGGVIGNIMFHIPLVVICVVIASLIECMLVLPAHMRFSLSRGTAIGGRHGSNFRRHVDRIFNEFRDQRFLPLVDSAVKNRALTLSLAVAALILAVGLVKGDRIGFTFFPSIDTTMVYANASFTSGTPRARVKTFMDHLEQTLHETEKTLGGGVVENIVIRMGEAQSGNLQGSRFGDQYAMVIMELTSPDRRAVGNQRFIDAWKQKIVMPPGIELFNIVQRTGGPPGQAIDFRLHGAGAAILKTAAAELKQKMQSYPGIYAIEDDMPWGQEQWIYELTPAGRALGLSVDQVGRQLRAAFDGALVQIFQDGDQELEVKVMLPEKERDRLTSLDALQIILDNGESVPVKTVLKLRSQRGFEALRHSDARLAIRVSADVNRQLNNSNRILDDLEQTYMPGLMGKYGLAYDLKGRAEDQRATISDIKLGAWLALALIYIILVWVFSSYSKPLVIMAAIPFGFIGAIFGHMVMGIELTILSLFGIVGLSGIVVNDSIILVSHYQHLRARGMTVAQAIPAASRDRFRAVLLTSLTTIAGLTPLMFETSVQAQFLIPMAVSITFGLAFSTILVLLVVPVILSYIESATSIVSGQARIEPGRHLSG